MRGTQRDFHKGVPFKLFVPALLLVLPLLLLGSNLVEAGPKLPASPAAQGSGGQAGNSQLVLRVYFRSIAERDSLATELDALEVPTTGGYLTIVSDQAGLDMLRGRGLRVEIDVRQTANLNKTVKFGNSPDNFFGGYHTVEEMQQFMDQEVAAYPNLAEKVDYGDSWCKAHAGQCTRPDLNNGYDLLAMHITNRNIPGPKPVVWIEGNIHAREIAPAEIALDYIAYLLDNYNSDADVHWLVDWQDIYVIPTVNPDGHHIVEAGGDSPYYQRKNANFTNGCITWPPAIGNQFGTDINRNFPFLWNCCNGSSGAPCAEAYHGPSANSEDETQAIVNKISQLIPDQRGPDITDPAPITTTGTFLDMHSFSDVNLYSWDMHNTPAPNDADLKNIAFHLSSTNAYPPGDDYTPCQFGHCLYIADGATNDWVYGELGAAGFAEEIGNDFFESYTTTQTILWPQNRGMMLYLAKVARMPYLMTRGPDTTLAAANPMTVTQGLPSELTATINYAWNYHDGYDNYLQNVAAAEYYLDTPPWAGGTPVAMQPVDGQFDSPVEAVRASIQTGSISVGRHVLFVRGRGVNDYEGYHSWGPLTAAWLTVQPYASPTPTATGTPPTATRTRTAVPTATATATPCSAPAIQNGGFETGSFSPGWTILNTEPTPVVSTLHAHSGTYSAFLGSVPNNEPFGDSSIYQQITVPASGSTLSYWYYPYSRDSIQFDWQDAYVTDTSGNILATIMHVLEGTERWTNVTFDLAPYAGQTIRIEFLVHQDGAGDVAHMYVDDVNLIETCPTPVPSTPSATASATYCPPAPTGTPTSIPRPCSPVTGVLLGEGFDQGTLGAFTSTVVLTNTGGWTPVPVSTLCYTNYAAFAPDPDTVSDQRLSLRNTIDIPANALHAELLFENNFAFQQSGNTYLDGGVLEFSTDGGASWFDAGAYIVIGGYNGTITRTGETCGGITPPFSNGQSAWVGSEETVVEVNLDSFIGSTFLFRFRLGSDCSGGGAGWYVDYVQLSYSYLYECTPTLTVSPTSASTQVAQTPTMTPTACAITFTDVPPGSTFYPYVRCLACLGIINGYPNGTFRPNANVTRGQLSKIVSNSAGFNDSQTVQMFQDVPVGSTFFQYIGRLASRGYINGYPCDGSLEPCVPPANLPYFSPNANATRGQISKIVSNAAGFNDPPSGQQFQDVPPGSTYYTYTYRLVTRSVMSGYPCGGAGEPCIPPANLPYFRPNNNATRGQTSKIVSNTFFPGCNPREP